MKQSGIDLEGLARQENISTERFLQRVKEGRVVILHNIKRENAPLAIGEGTRVKINANIGSSQVLHDQSGELSKARTAVRFGADTIMDLSTGGTEDDIRVSQQKILSGIPVVLGTVPIYQAAVRMHDANKPIIDMTEDDMLNIVEEQAKRGVDFFTIHAGVKKNMVDHLVQHPRIMGIVSRGGTFTAAWMLHHDRENPFFTNFDTVLDIMAEYKVAMSLGDGFRPGSTLDGTDYCQLQELLEISRLVKRCKERGIPVIVEGPGHLPANQVMENIRIQKDLCDGVPFYVLGPIVTDIAPGYDELVGAIGGVLAGLAGADYLCYVTPAEHLGLPTIEDVKRGVIASRLAAHVIDVARGNPSALTKERSLSLARRNLDWEGVFHNSIDPEGARQRHARQCPDKEECSMCGPFCAIKLLDQYINQNIKSNDEKHGK
ncbi:MAG: phosphomethylpyrimidine synthase ThiC [Candidatus Hodarchaeota archaeon]